MLYWPLFYSQKLIMIWKSRQKRGAYRHWKESLTQQYSQQVMHGQKGSKLRWLSTQLKLALNRLFRSLKIQPVCTGFILYFPFFWTQSLSLEVHWVHKCVPRPTWLAWAVLFSELHCWRDHKYVGIISLTCKSWESMMQVSECCFASV